MNYPKARFQHLHPRLIDEVIKSKNWQRECTEWVTHWLQFRAGGYFTSAPCWRVRGLLRKRSDKFEFWLLFYCDNNNILTMELVVSVAVFFPVTKALNSSSSFSACTKAFLCSLVIVKASPTCGTVTNGWMDVYKHYNAIHWWVNAGKSLQFLTTQCSNETQQSSV